MKPLKPLGLALRALVLLFALWLYGGDLIRWIRAQSAPVSAFNELPSLALSVLGAACALGGAVVLAIAVAQRKAASWRVLQLLTLSLVSLFFFDFVLLSASRSPLTPPERLLSALQGATDGIQALAVPQGVPRDPALLAEVVDELGAVPLFERGVRVPRWTVELRERCTGPALDTGASGPGTFLYCVSVDRRRAWLTVVGLAPGEVFSEKATAIAGDGWVGEVQAPPERERPSEPRAPPEQPVWGVPTDDAPQ